MTPPRTWRVALLALALIAPAGPAAAQDDTWYAVELIVFANIDGAAYGEEIWPVDPGAPDLSRAVPVAEGIGVPPVSPAAYRLSGVWQALKGSREYRPLRHLAWTQPGETPRGAPVVLVGEEPEAAVRGLVQITRGRFLHARVDLVYDDAGDRYRLEARRRMRSNELHYIDHPLFGVLVIVTPLRD